MSHEQDLQTLICLRMPALNIFLQGGSVLLPDLMLKHDLGPLYEMRKDERAIRGKVDLLAEELQP